MRVPAPQAVKTFVETWEEKREKYQNKWAAGA